MSKNLYKIWFYLDFRQKWCNFALSKQGFEQSRTQMMKLLAKHILIAIFASVATTAVAQHIAIGERIARIKEIKEYRKQHKAEHQYQYIGFVHTTSIPSAITSEDLLGMADSADVMDVIFLSKESLDLTADWFRRDADNRTATFAEMKHIFKRYGIEYVPYGVITDSRRRVVWAGNPELLTTAKIKNIVENHKSLCRSQR